MLVLDPDIDSTTGRIGRPRNRHIRCIDGDSEATQRRRNEIGRDRAVGYVQVVGLNYRNANDQSTEAKDVDQLRRHAATVARRLFTLKAVSLPPRTLTGVSVLHGASRYFIVTGAATSDRTA